MAYAREMSWHCRGLAVALMVFWASNTGCTTVDCPSGSEERGGQCALIGGGAVDGSSRGRIDSLESEAGVRDAEIVVGSPGGSGAAANGGAGAAGSRANRPPRAGSSGSGGRAAGGAGGSILSSRDPCSSAGAMRCSALGEGKREQCTEGRWTPADACADGQTCVAGGDDQGACVKRAEVCRGNGGKAVCDAEGSLVICNADESIKSQAVCQSPRLCWAGVAAQVCAVCVPDDEYRCTGKTLERCAADGMGFAKHLECETAALCNKTAGMCTASACAAGKTSCDGNLLQVCNAEGTAFEVTVTCGAGTTCDATGGDCNKCVPGSKKCDGDMVATCDAKGQSYTPSACPAGNHCVGLGQCVECASNADCSSLTKDCKVGMCSQNVCAARNQPGGTSCAAAGGKPGMCVIGACQCSPQCDGKQCGDDGCGGTCPPGCADGMMCVGDQCVECQNDAQCSNLNAAQGCVEGYCEAGMCKARNAPSTQRCGGSGTCKGGSCCTPNCNNKCGGADDGCGGKCSGTCSGGATCTNGMCCAPNCNNKCGGADDGCGGKCSGTCSGGATCNNGMCCAPNCSGKCGGADDGCGGTCPNPCSGGQSCSAGKCCSPNCNNKCGGADDGCGGKCTNACGGSATCYNNTCCAPNCNNKCGGESNGCGGTCPDSCGAGASCSAGKCCTPNCNNKCGGADDGCGGKCTAACSGSGVCYNNACCAPSCTGKCGGESNGCGGVCPDPCKSGEACSAGKCTQPTPTLGNLYDACDDRIFPSCNPGLVCTRVGAGGSYCFTTVVDNKCPAPLVSFMDKICLATCPGTDVGKASATCPTAAKTCYGALYVDPGYCVPST